MLNTQTHTSAVSRISRPLKQDFFGGPWAKITVQFFKKKWPKKDHHFGIRKSDDTSSRGVDFIWKAHRGRAARRRSEIRWHWHSHWYLPKTLPPTMNISIIDKCESLPESYDSDIADQLCSYMTSLENILDLRFCCFVFNTNKTPR